MKNKAQCFGIRDTMIVDHDICLEFVQEPNGLEFWFMNMYQMVLCWSISWVSSHLGNIKHLIKKNFRLVLLITSWNA